MLHKLFALPLEDGLCAVLRTAAEVTEVIRPTQNGGLWILTDGYCDIDAVQACVPKIHQSVELLRSVGVRLIGSVVNGVGSKADRRVTHLQQATPRSQQKKLEAAEA